MTLIGDKIWGQSSNYLEEINIKYCVKQKALLFTDKQPEEIPSRVRRLNRMLLSNDFQVVIDDEKYFMFINPSVPTNRGYYTSNKAETPSGVRFKRTRSNCHLDKGNIITFFRQTKRSSKRKDVFQRMYCKTFNSSYYLNENVLF